MKAGLTKGGIRRQLTLHLVFFALALGALFGIFTLMVFHRVEDRVIKRQLEQMLEAEQPISRPSAVDYAGSVSAAPEPFRQRLDGLEPGQYEWLDASSETHVLVVENPASAERRVAIASFAESEALQNRLGFALLAGIAVTSLLALWMARYLAAHIVAPIEQLTEQLDGGALEGTLATELPSTQRSDEIGTLSTALQRASHQLVASAERERRFLRQASHELRTPITVIQGVSELLRESVAADDTLTRQRLDRLSRGLRRMNTSVLSLLAMARTEHRLRQADLPSFDQQIEDLVEECRSISHPGVTISHRQSNAPGDELAAAMLIVALSNLMRNAAQHCAHGTVDLEVEAGRATVRDDGTGLSAELLDQLRTEGPRPDLGIGLATVLRICQRFGWSLSVDCPPTGGTVVCIDWRET